MEPSSFTNTRKVYEPSEASSGVSFSVYKQEKLDSLQQRYPEVALEELGPLDNVGSSIYPSKFDLANATAEEIDIMKKLMPTKVRLHREVSKRKFAAVSVPMFEKYERNLSKNMSSTIGGRSLKHHSK